MVCCGTAWHVVMRRGVVWRGLLCCVVLRCGMCAVMRCDVVWRFVVWCCVVVWCGAVWWCGVCGMAWCVWYGVVRYVVVWCYAAWCGLVYSGLRCAVL